MRIQRLVHAERRRRFGYGALALLVAAWAAAGCDTPSGPLPDLLVASETQAALAVAEALPTLDRMAVRRVPPGDRVGSDIAVHAAADSTPAEGASGPVLWVEFADDPETRLASAQVLWIEADSMPAESASVARERAYALAAPVLAAGIDPDFLHEAFDDLQAWIDTARPAVDLGAVPDLKQTLQAGAEGLAMARRAAEAGDTVTAIRATLRSADALRETTPPVVAARLIRDTEARLAAAAPDRIEPTPDPRDRRAVALSRARRLLAGAREAMGEDDPVLAIRHAYYAARLLDAVAE